MVCSDRCWMPRTLLLKQLNIMTRYSLVPRKWQYSETVQLDKQNFKLGPAAIRLINLLCPMGKVFFKTLWAKLNKPRYPFAYGFYQRRRREQAILIQNCTRWRLRDLQKQQPPRRKHLFNHTSTLRDIANAFPSMGHAALDKMLNDLGQDGPLTRMLRHRYKQAVMIIRDPHGAGIVIHPQCGGLQGDATKPEMFSATYDPHVDAWINNRCTQLTDHVILATDPLTGVTLEIGTTLYADDIQETNLTPDAAALEVVEKTSTDLLNAELRALDMAQNTSKAEHIVCFFGPNSNKETAKAEKRNDDPAKGKTCDQAKYLGNICHYTGKTKYNTERRRKAFREGYYMVQKFLQCTEIELRLRRPVFLNLVYNTFLSGLEPEQVHFTELKTCDQEMVGYMKKCYKPMHLCYLPPGKNTGNLMSRSANL